MSDTTYNGWSNYSTWVVNLWLDNDGFQSEIAEWAIECTQDAIDNDASDIQSIACYDLSKRIEYYVVELQEMAEINTTGMFADLLSHAIGLVDWYEIAKNYIDEIAIYCAGSNMPGYMPDSSPSMFTNSDDAIEHIEELMQSDAEDNDLWTESEIDSIDSIKADKNGEYGCTIHGRHYFVSIA